MTNQKVAEMFADRKSETVRGRAIQSMSMFVNGDTVFSYGYHFPIARHTEKVDEHGKPIVLFTNRGYSNTTAKHKNHVYFALLNAGYRIITTDISMSRPSAVIEALNKEIDELHGKEKRARKEWTRESYFNQAEKLNEDVATLRQAFSL